MLETVRAGPARGPSPARAGVARAGVRYRGAVLAPAGVPCRGAVLAKYQPA